jgi:two-component system sensor histidine kinase MtrB
MGPARRPLGLRTRVSLSYALGALALSSALALAVPALVQQRLLTNTQSAAQGQVWRNAEALRRDIASSNNDGIPLTENAISSSLDDLLRSNGALVLLLLPDGEPRSLSGLLETNIPLSLAETVATAGAGQQLTNVNDLPQLVIGLHIAEIDATYYELVPLDDLNTTLNTLRVVLGLMAIGSGVAAALIGYYSSRRLLHPLSEVATAAQAIASGRFDTQLEEQPDPDLGRLTSSFNDMGRALRQRIERDQRFASDVSHELRSPLMTLSASVEVLKGRQEEMPEAARQAVDLLASDISRFQQLVADLLEISQLDAGAIVLDRSPLLVGEFLSRVLAQFGADAELSPDPVASQLAVLGDKRRLAQAVSNLLENANKYGGGAKLIRFSAIGTVVAIEVIDDGPGVPAADRIRIFERFSRGGADAGRRETATGVGLGLSLVSEHIKLHDGRVYVTDRLDGASGARFVIELPIFETAAEYEEFAR